MSKNIYPDTQSFVLKKSFLLAIVFLLLGLNNRSFSQCNVAVETNPQSVTPSACNNGTLNMGSGAYWFLTVNTNTYYNFSFAANTGCVSGFCAVPQNGNAVSFSSNISSWFSGTTTSLLVSANRNGCFASGTSSVLTYRYSTPTISSVSASPDPICAGSTLTLTGSVSDAATLTWAGASFSGSGSTTTESNIQPANAGVYTLTADNSGCSVSANTSSVVVNTPATANAGGNQSTCSSAGAVSITGANASNYTSLSWSGGSGSFTNGTTLSPAYTPSAGDISTGSVTLTLTANSSAPCGAVTSSKVLTITAAPTASAGGNQTVCSNAGAFSVTGATATNTGAGISWGTSGTGGVFTNGNTLTPSYTPSASDLLTGSVTLTLTVSATSPCVAATSSKLITFFAAPAASAGANQSTCSNGGAVSITGATASNATGVNWITSGNGTFTGAATLTPVYTPGSIDIANGSVTLTLTATGTSPCTTASSSKTLTVVPKPIVNAGSAQSTCANSGTVSITGATASNYSSLSWVSSGSGTFTNSTTLITGYTPSGADTIAGSVTLTLTASGNGPCASASSSKVLTFNPLPIGSIAGTTSICTGSSATLTFNLATASPFNIIYTDGTNSYSANGVSSGQTTLVSPTAASTTYQYTSITDANGCVRSSNFFGGATITVTPLPVISGVTNSPVLCNGTSTGSLTLTGASGTPGYTYSINGGATFQINNVFSNLPAANNYVLEIKDSHGCSSFYASNPVTVTQPTVLTQTDSSIHASCANVFDGSIMVTASGGVGPYNYSLNGGPSQTGSTFGNLGAGTYVVQVADFNGCTDTASVTIFNSYAVSDSLLSKTGVSCFGGADGALTVQLSGGVPAYSYSDNGSTYQSSPTFTGLTAGNYIITLRDSRGCTDFLQVNIAQPALLDILIDTVQNVLCRGGAQGAIYIGVNGGTSPYSFFWSNSATTQDVTNLTAGTYNVTVLDSKGCNSSAGATITQPLPLFLNIATYHNLSCYNDSSGSILATCNGGVPPYTYSWSNGATTQDITGLGVGTYTLTVVDANGCQAVISQTIAQPAALASIISAVNVSCNGASNGSVTFSVNGGTSPYSYLWSNGATSQNLNNVSGGTYTVVVHDANGCSLAGSITVAEPAAIVLGISSTNVSCNGGSNGTVTTTVTGGSGTITYLWSNGATTQNLTNVPAGPYSVSITDGNNCSASAGVTVTQPTALVLNGTVANVSCSGGNNGSVAITVTGGVSPYSYSWSNGATTQNINGVTATTYLVTATDVNLCTITATFNVNSPSPITSSVAGTNVTCHAQANGTATLTVNGGTAPYAYSWSNFQATQNLSGLSGGTYYVIITDANGCTRRDSVIITEPTAIVLGISNTNVSCNGGLNGTVTTTVSGGTGTITYLWSNAASTQNLTNVGAGNYSVVIADSNSCSASASVTVTQPTALVLNGTVANVSCSGGNNGSVAITVNGGVFPYSYAWSNGATSQNINALIGGSYIVTATDANLCTITASFNVNSPSPITSSVVGTNVTCHGQANGTATLSVSGGTAPYSYLWSNFQATQNLSGLSGGTYYVIITDANGCNKRDSVIITEPAAIVLGITATNVSCNGGSNGTVTTTVTGGTGTITYAWSNGATTQNLSNAGPGNYSVTITDANLCTASASATITQPTALVLNGTVANVGCFGGNNGAIQITVNGGVFPYSYAWSNGATTQNVNGLAGGVTYTVTANDANLCTITASFNVTSPSALVTVISGTDVTCHGAGDGTAGVSVSGGTSPYTYLWSNFQGSSSVSNLSGGLYYVIVTDGNGCSSKDSILINEATQVVIASSVMQITCFNANNGGINLSVTGGMPGYTYNWSPALSNNPSQTGLAEGTYLVTVTDTHSCSASAQIDLVNPPVIAVNFVVTNPRCYGDSNGVVNMITSGGEPAYSFAWSNGDTTAQLTHAPVGTYTVTITDARGCVQVDSAQVATPTLLYTSGVIKNVSCFGANDGQVNVTVYGGTLPYSYQWSSGSSTEDLYNLGGSNNYLTVTDANGCQVSSLYIVHEPSLLTLGIGAGNVSCFGGNNGSLTALPSGGTKPYRYLWSNFSPDSLQSGVAAGSYNLQLIDSNGCYAFDSSVVTQPSKISITGFSNNAVCFNTATGSVDITATGGTPGYTYLWSNGGVDSAINTISAGIYVVTVTDASNCSSTASFTVQQGTKVIIDLATYDPICYGGNTGAITALVTGGSQPYRYTWSNSPNDTVVSIGHLVAGTYGVTVTDNVGCSTTADGTLNQPALITLTPSVAGARCLNSASGIVVANTTGGTAPFNYSLNGRGQSTDTFTHVLPGSYELIATDVNGCQGTDTFSISAPNNITVTLSVNDQVIITGMQTQLSATATSNTPIINYFWSPIAVDSVDVFDYSSCGDSSNCPAPYVKPPFTAIFMVTAMNADSCTASDTVTVYVNHSEFPQFFPTAFTPNGDGLNDRFTFAILGATKIEVSIFDRWGQRAYYDAAQPNGVSDSYGWDGTIGGKKAPEDTYVYQLSVTYFDGSVKAKAGTITLMR